MRNIKIYIAFSKVSYVNTKLFEKVIARWTNGPYYHSEMILPDTRYNSGYKMCSSLSEDGVRCAEHFFNNERYDYKEIYVTKEQLCIINEFYKSINNFKYDKLGILGFVLPTQDRSDRWFCSETNANALKIIGYKPMWCIEASSVSPNYLGRITGMLNNKQPSYFKRIINLKG